MHVFLLFQQWIKHFESTSLLSQAEVHFGCSSSCVPLRLEDLRTPGRPRHTNRKLKTQQDSLQRRGTSPSVRVTCYITTECSDFWPHLSVQNPLKGLSLGKKAHACLKNDTLFCLSFVFLFYTTQTVPHRWMTDIDRWFDSQAILQKTMNVQNVAKPLGT